MPEFKIVALCLHGESTPEGRTKSILAFGEFKKMHTLGNIGGSQMTYTDSYGFIVFCVALLVGEGYTPDYYVQSWEKICKQFELNKTGSSYEGALDFFNTVNGDYITKTSKHE